MKMQAKQIITAVSLLGCSMASFAVPNDFTLTPTFAFSLGAQTSTYKDFPNDLFTTTDGKIFYGNSNTKIYGNRTLNHATLVVNDQSGKPLCTLIVSGCNSIIGRHCASFVTSLLKGKQSRCKYTGTKPGFGQLDLNPAFNETRYWT